MPAMTDPMDALIDFRRAIAQREIRVQPADFHPDVFVHVDQPAGAPRYTYALIEDGEVTAVALLALTEPVEGVPTFQLEFRGQRVPGTVYLFAVIYGGVPGTVYLFAVIYKRRVPLQG